MTGYIYAEVIAERLRQIDVEGWTPQLDDRHRQGELLAAARCYYLHATGHHDAPMIDGAPVNWPFDSQWWKPKDRRRDLVRAGALCLAELARYHRAGVPSAHRVDTLLSMIVKALAGTP